jgi:hypothetical protein
MAKVEGPLYSMGASGKLGNAMVFFGWKGLNVVRSWVKPANPQTENQGDQRIFVGGTGRAVGKIQVGEAFAQQLIDLKLIPGGQTKQSYLVSYIVQNYLGDATLYAAELAELTGHTAYTSFQAAADSLTIAEFDLDYASVAPYDKALGVYLIAKAAIALELEGTPYTTAITEWVQADVEGLVEDMIGS